MADPSNARYHESLIWGIEMETIHVVFALYDAVGSYSKYLGIAMLSLFEHTESKICVHILCDATVSRDNQKRFLILARQYGHEVRFYQLDTGCYESFHEMASFFTIGTLFRLQILQVLPASLSKIIYLDDDLLVNMDVHELWDVDLSGCVIAACCDPGLPFLEELPFPCRAGWVSSGEYFNAGVMVIDLVRMRQKGNFFESAMCFLKDNPGCNFVDQDVLNVFFQGQVYYLPAYCNLFSRLLRGQVDAPQRCICHMGSDHVDSEQPMWFDRLFFEYWERSPWAVGSEMLPYFLTREKRHAMQIFLWQKVAVVLAERRRPFIVWGVASALRDQLQAVCPALNEPDWYVDSNSKLQRHSVDGKEIKRPETLANYVNAAKPFVLVLSKKFYREISLKLISYGYQENKDYGDGALLLLQSQGGVFVGY